MTVSYEVAKKELLRSRRLKHPPPHTHTHTHTRTHPTHARTCGRRHARIAYGRALAPTRAVLPRMLRRFLGGATGSAAACALVRLVPGLVASAACRHVIDR